MTDTKNKKDRSTPNSIRSNDDQFSRPSSGNPHLPGGLSYRKIFDNDPRSNPRKDKTALQWLHEWEQNWNGIANEHNKYGKPKL